MIGRALDENNDIVLLNGSFATVKDGAEVLQHIKARLDAFKGEWFLDVESGTPWFQDIFVNPVNIANIESIIKSRIIETKGVLKLLTFETNYTSNDRKMFITYSGETKYGVITSEVIING